MECFVQLSPVLLWYHKFGFQYYTYSVLYYYFHLICIILRSTISQNNWQVPEATTGYCTGVWKGPIIHRQCYLETDPALVFF